MNFLEGDITNLMSDSNTPPQPTPAEQMAAFASAMQDWSARSIERREQQRKALELLRSYGLEGEPSFRSDMVSVSIESIIRHFGPDALKKPT